MELIEIIKLGGPTAVGLIAVIVIVKAFLSASAKRDESFNEILEKFSTIITNHIEHNTEAITKNTEVTNRTILMLQNLCDWLKNNK